MVDKIASIVKSAFKDIAEEKKENLQLTYKGRASPSSIWLAGTLPPSCCGEFHTVHMHSLLLLWNIFRAPASLAFSFYYLYKCLIFLSKINSSPSISKRQYDQYPKGVFYCNKCSLLVYQKCASSSHLKRTVMNCTNSQIKGPLIKIIVPKHLTSTVN